MYAGLEKAAKPFVVELAISPIKAPPFTVIPYPI